MTYWLNKLIANNTNLRLDQDTKFHDWSSWFQALGFIEQNNLKTSAWEIKSCK